MSLLCTAGLWTVLLAAVSIINAKPVNTNSDIESHKTPDNEN